MHTFCFVRSVVYNTDILFVLYLRFNRIVQHYYVLVKEKVLKFYKIKAVWEWHGDTNDRRSGRNIIFNGN